MKLKTVSKRDKFKVLLIALMAIIFLQKPAAAYTGDSQAKAAVPDLIEALKDEDEHVREDAAQALEKINTPEARKALREYYKKKSK